MNDVGDLTLRDGVMLGLLRKYFGTAIITMLSITPFSYSYRCLYRVGVEVALSPPEVERPINS